MVAALLSSGFRGGRFAALRVPEIGELFRCRAGAVLHERLDPPGEHPAREHDPAPATETDETDVRTQPDDLPVRAAARMRLPEAYNVIKRNVEWHTELPTRPPALHQPFHIRE